MSQNLQIFAFIIIPLLLMVVFPALVCMGKSILTLREEFKVLEVKQNLHDASLSEIGTDIKKILKFVYRNSGSANDIDDPTTIHRFE